MTRRALVELAFDHELLERGEHVVVGVSGGADSMVLLELLAALRASWELQLSAVHVNYGLRGQDSLLDEQLVHRRCRQLDIHLTLHRATELQANDSNLEDRARLIRHKVLRDTSREVGASAIALGHTLDDQAETILLHLLRGSGLTGLQGMQAREGQIVRPLLGARRLQVRQYAAERGIMYRNDASNLDQRFMRNRVRHLLIPLLIEQFNPRIVENLANSAELVATDEMFMDELAESIYRRFVKEVVDGSVQIAAEELLELPLSLQRRVLRQMVRTVLPKKSPVGFRQAVQAALSGLVKSNAGVEFPLGRGLTLKRSRGMVAISLATKNAQKES